MNKTDFLTYWPGSRGIYSGEHIKRDPGLQSPHILATFNYETSEAVPVNSDLIETVKQVNSDTAIGNEANLEALQVIRLQEQIMGRPEQPFYLEQAATVRNVDMLESRETFRSIGDSVKRKDRLEETPEKTTKYAEIRYDVSKLSGKVLTPIEDKMRTVRDPQAIDLENLDFEFAQKRNEELKDVIEAIPTRGADGTTTATALGDIRTTASNPHSTANVAMALAAGIKTFMTRNKIPIDTVVMDVDAMSRWSANTWVTKGGQFGLAPIYLPNGGVVELPGFPGITAIVEPTLADNKKLYCFNKMNALRIAQGPTLYRRAYDENRHAETISVLDFVQFLAVDSEISHSKIGNRYFGFEAVYATA